MWHMDVGWGAWLVMTVGMVAFWGLVIGVVVYLVRGGRPEQQVARASAEEILAERLARGEIDAADYYERMEALGAGGDRPPAVAPSRDDGQTPGEGP